MNAPRRTLTVPRTAYRALVARVNLANARRRIDEAGRWAWVRDAYARTGEPLPRPWRTDLRTVGARDHDNF